MFEPTKQTDHDKSIEVVLREEFRAGDNFPRATGYENGVILNQRASLLFLKSIGTDAGHSILEQNFVENHCSGISRNSVIDYLKTEETGCGSVVNLYSCLLRKRQSEQYGTLKKDPDFDIYNRLEEPRVLFGQFANANVAARHFQSFPRHDPEDLFNAPDAIWNLLVWKVLWPKYVQKWKSIRTALGVLFNIPENCCFNVEAVEYLIEKVPCLVNVAFLDSQHLCHDSPRAFPVLEKVLNHPLCTPRDVFPDVSPCSFDSLRLKHDYLTGFVMENDRRIPLYPFFGEGDDAWKCVYSFVNAHGNCKQKVIKILRDDRRKMLVPCVSYTDRDAPLSNGIFCVPLFDQQPLYNLDILESRPGGTVMLADSIEIADLNQRDKSELVWTAWYGGSEALEFVDWTPLEDRDVYLVICPHSDITLEESCVNAKETIEFLRENQEKIYDKLRIAVIPVEHVEFYMKSPADFWSDRNLPELEPYVFKDAIRCFSAGDFSKLSAMAEQRIELMAHPFYMSVDELPLPEEHEDEIPDLPLDYVIRPILHEKLPTLLYATRGTGKTSFALSLCGALISGNAGNKSENGRWVINGKCWTIPKTVRETAAAMFFDFELFSKPDDMIRCRRRCLEPYLPDSQEKKDEHLRRFDMQHIDPQEFNVLEDRGREEVMKRIKRFMTQLPAGTKLKLVVLDNYLAMTRGEDSSNTFYDLAPLIKEITATGSAVLIIHHTNKDGEQYGSISKENLVKAAFHIHRRNDERVSKEDVGTLCKPVKVNMNKGSLSPCELDFEEFQMRWQDGGPWVIHEPKTDANEEFRQIVNVYSSDKKRPKKQSVSKAEIYELMGYGKQAFSNIINGITKLGPKSDQQED